MKNRERKGEDMQIEAGPPEHPLQTPEKQLNSQIQQINSGLTPTSTKWLQLPTEPDPLGRTK